MLDNYREQFIGTNYNRSEQVPGAFAEYAYNYLDKFNLVARLAWRHRIVFMADSLPRGYMYVMRHLKRRLYGHQWAEHSVPQTYLPRIWAL